MKIRKLLVAIAFFVGSFCSYGQLLQWNTFGNSGTETTEPSVANDVNVASANLTFGSGVTAAANGDRFGGNNWFDNGNTASGNTLNEAISGNNFIQFTVTSNSGFSFTPTSLVFRWDRSSTGPNSVTLRSSVDGYSANLGSVTGMAAALTTGNTIIISGLTNITTATTFRLYGYGATGTGGSGGFDQPSVSPGVVNVVLNGTTSPTGITSTQNGAWSSATTWVGGVVPTAAQNVIIAHNVTTGAITRDSGTTTTINSGANLAVSGSYTNNGTTTVNGTFQIDQGGFGGGSGTYTYGGASNLVYNHTSGVYGPIDSFHSYWPATNSPFNVSILNSGSGGINLGVSRTVTGTFATAAGVTLTSSNLTLNGTCQINGGGFFNNPPIYGNASTLVYNASFNVGNEWTGNSITAGTGIPQNVTIQNSASVSMPNGNRGMAGNLNITSGSLTLNGTSGDLYVAGNWTRASTATFTPNNRAVFFNGSATKTVTVAPTGTETFNFLLVEGSGTLRLATNTNIVVTASSGLTLTSSNATSTIDLNGQTLTLSGGGNLNLNTGARRITSTVANGRLVLSAGTLTVTNGGSLSTEANTIVDLKAGLDSGTGSLLTINGTLQINLGGFCNVNLPKYGASSLLQYNTTGTYGRGFEWLALGVGTIGTTPGYPNNVQISNNTILNYNNGTPLAKAINGTLTIDSGSTFDMANGTPTSAGDFTIAGAVSNSGTFIFPNVASSVVVAGNYNNSGTTTLGTVGGADLKLAGNFNNSGTFNGNARAVFFTKTGTQVVTSSSTLTFPYLVTTGTGTIVQLATGTNLILSAPNTGNAVSFGNANDVIDINGNSLTIGTAATANVINGLGSFKGSNTSNLTLLGTGSVGTLRFTNGVLGDLTLNRQASNIGFDLGTGLIINGILALTNGIANLSNQTLIIAANGSISGASPSNYIIADFTAGGVLRKNFTNGTGTTSNFTFPIGDRAASADGMQYSPATIDFTTANYSSGWAALAVEDNAEPNIGSPPAFISRYWRLTSSGISNATYNFTGTYLPIDVVGTESNCKSGRYSTSNNTWTDGANLVPGTNTVLLTGLTSATGALTSPNHFTASFRNQEINISGGSNNIVNGSVVANGLNNTLFAATNIGSSATKDYLIQNLGIAILNLTGTPVVSIGGVNPGDFSVTTIPSLTAIAGGLSTTFIITFTPTSTGIRTAIVSITNNDSDENPYTFLIQGTGTCPLLTNTITPTSGPVGTEITITSSSSITNNLSGATATFNGVAAAPVTIISTSQIKVSVPPLAISGNLITTNIQGCQATNAFTVIDNKANTCQGGALATELFFSEVTDGTVGGLSYVEIYNGSSSIVDMGGYSLKIYSDGNNATPTTLPLINYNLNPGSIFVVAIGITDTPTTSNTCSITGGNGQLANQTSTTSGINFNTSGNDYIGLYKNSTLSIIDSFGTFGSNNWADGLGLGDRGATFRRKNIATLPNLTFSSSDWNIINWDGQGQGSCFSNDYSNIGVYSFLAGTPPTVTQHPTYTPTCKATSLTIAGTEGFVGGNALTYQWFVSAANATGWTEISSTTDGSIYTNFNTATLNISNISGILNSQFYCQIRENTNTCYSASNAVKIISGQSSTWQSGNTWSNGPPTLDKAIIINNNYDTSVSGSFEACSVTVNNGFTLDVKAGTVVSINNDLAVNAGASLLVQNNGSLVMIKDNGVVTNNGTTQVSRTTTPYERFDYTYWSSPVNNANITSTFTGWRTDNSYDFITPNFYDTRTINSIVGDVFGSDTFDDAAPWAWQSFTGSMTNGKGYAIMAPTSGSFPTTNTVTFSGRVNNGIITPKIFETANIDAGYVGLNNPNDDYNLVGNPYPSAISADKFITANFSNISGTLYFWTHVGDISVSNPGPGLYNFTSDDYALYNRSGGTRASLTGTVIPTGFIASGQGFFVEAQANNVDLIFNNDMRIKTPNNGVYHDNSNFFRTSNSSSEKDRIWLNLQNSVGMFSQQLIAYFDETTLDYDWAYDGRVNQSNNYVSFYSIAGLEKYKIQARPAFDISDIVPLGYSSAVSGEFSINIDNKEGIFNVETTPVYLQDLELQIIHDLRASPYTFTTNSGIFENRFLLRYTSALNNPNLETLNNSVVVAHNDGKIIIKSSNESIQDITVYDILGRLLLDARGISKTEFMTSNISNSNQAVVVKIKLDNGVIVTRKILL